MNSTRRQDYVHNFTEKIEEREISRACKEEEIKYNARWKKRRGLDGRGSHSGQKAARERTRLYRQDKSRSREYS